MTTLTEQVDAAISWTLAIRGVPARNADRAVLARATQPQHFAAAFSVLAGAGHLRDVPPKVRHGAVLACALAAENRRVPNGTARLGAAFRRIDSPNIGTILANVTGSSLAVTTRLLGSLVRRAGAAGADVNFYDLGRTLAFWDTGTNTARRTHRSRIVYDFHSTSKPEEAAR